MMSYLSLKLKKKIACYAGRKEETYFPIKTTFV